MRHSSYFRLLKIYSDLWARRNCRVIMSGEEKLDAAGPRIYVVSHPTTWDLPLLAHLARNNFYVVVAEGPFAHPLVAWLFRGAGFIELQSDDSAKAIQHSCQIIQSGRPLIYSLKGFGVDYGEDVRPRTGSIRIAHYSGADIYPVHLMIEEGKRIFKYYRKSETESHKYTVFSDTLYFVTFCEPLRYSEYAKGDMEYEDYREIAYGIEETFVQQQRRIEKQLEEDREYYRGLKRRGGSKKRVFF